MEEHADVAEMMKVLLTLSMGRKWSLRLTAPEQEHVISNPPGFTTRMACIPKQPSGRESRGGRGVRGRISHQAFLLLSISLLGVAQHLFTCDMIHAAGATLLVMRTDTKMIDQTTFN